MDTRIKYRPYGPQISFHQSLAKFRSFIGGLGSGKTIAGSAEAIQISNKYPGSLGVILAPCYDDKTEVLTEDGWKCFSELNDEKVATLLDEKIVFQRPKQKFKYQFDGELICLNNQEIDMAVTPNHRCLVRFKKRPWSIKRAEEIYGKWDYKFRKTAEWKGRKDFNKDWMEFLGYWFAEGCAEFNREKRKYRVTLTTVNDVDYCEKLLSKNFSEFSKDKRTGGGFNFTIYNKKFARQFVRYGKALTKTVPKRFKEQSAALLRAFLKGFIMGDGSFKKTKHGQTQMWTSSKSLANDLQEISFKAGYNCSMVERKRKGEYYLCIRTRKKNEPKTCKSHWNKKSYSGYVYCVQVNGGIILVRRNGKFYFCGNTYPMLRDSTIRTFMDLIPHELVLSFNKSENHLVLVNGTEILFRPGNDTAAIDRLRNINVDWFWMDEASLFLEYAWRVLIGRLRGKTGPRRGWVTTTPKGYNWTWKKFVSDRNPDYDHVTASSLDNPYLPEDYKKSLQEEYKGIFAKQEIYGLFVGFEGAVYPEFSRNVHVKETKDVKFEAVVGAVDFGFTNPSAVLKIGIDYDGRMYVTDEFYERHVTDSELARWAKENMGDVEVFIADSANPSGIAEFDALGLECKGVEKETGEKEENFVSAGIKKVSAMLAVQDDGKPRLFVDPKCVNTIMEFENYRYPEKEEEKPEKEAPLKVHDHALDALRYAVVTLAKEFESIAYLEE